VRFRRNDLKFERLVLIGQRQRQEPACGSAGRTPRGAKPRGGALPLLVF
jgi:hypothetical protein